MTNVCLYLFHMPVLLSWQTSAVHLFFNDVDVESLERLAANTPTKFLSTCGGLLGLCLGFSVLSLIEFIYYATLRLYWTLRKQRSKIVVEPFKPSVDSVQSKKKYAYKNRVNFKAFEPPQMTKRLRSPRFKQNERF